MHSSIFLNSYILLHISFNSSDLKYDISKEGNEMDKNDNIKINIEYIYNEKYKGIAWPFWTNSSILSEYLYFSQTPSSSHGSSQHLQKAGSSRNSPTFLSGVFAFLWIKANLISPKLFKNS